MHRGANRFLKLALVAIILAASVEASVRLLSWAVAPKGPRIEFQSVIHEAGVTTEDKPIEHEFVFKNTGTKPLKIESISTSCGCTVAEMGKKEYRPGESGTLKARMKFSAVGINAQQVLVRSNASSEPIILTMQVDYRPPAYAVAVPTRLALASTPGASASLQVEVFTVAPSVFEVEVDSPGSRMLEARVLGKQRSGRVTSAGYYRTSLELEVQTKQAPVGSKTDKLALRFRPPIMPPIEVPVVFEEITPWICRPSKAFIVFSAAADMPREQSIAIVSCPPRAFAIRRITNPFSSWLDITPRVGSPLGSAQLDLRVKHRPQDARLEGAIEVVLKPVDEPERTLTIPVSVRNLRQEREERGHAELNP